MSPYADANEELNENDQKTPLESRLTSVGGLESPHDSTQSRSYNDIIQYNEVDLRRRALESPSEASLPASPEPPIPLTEADDLHLMGVNIDQIHEALQMCNELYPPSYISDGIYIGKYVALILHLR